eukprot:CAMPEP_0117673122 /NCGR_PEP_ID=MMETSP0804-20121206/14297_1 /TAXON_ID=1074897 /ORGANISM="Tetraselmis astigmatica, Strain CCMP880" /LENGTH=129 /DNA_ID=CAMNT_0005481825 /DNA_START=116 /DNA_END=505 /DNA_ORIENTATION=+
MSKAAVPQQFGQASLDKRLSLHTNNTVSRVCMKANKAYQLEVAVGPNENTDSALRRFRRAVNEANIIPEVKRRRTFENGQDRMKRKIKERGLRKKRFSRPQTWEQAQTNVDPAPFADMFGDADDIFSDV